MHAWMTAPTFSLSAYGETRVTPDMATISTGVQTEAPTAEAAMAENRAWKLSGTTQAQLMLISAGRLAFTP